MYNKIKGVKGFRARENGNEFSFKLIKILDLRDFHFPSEAPGTWNVYENART
jgi:hypothetical protein